MSLKIKNTSVIISCKRNQNKINFEKNLSERGRVYSIHTRPSDLHGLSLYTLRVGNRKIK